MRDIHAVATNPRARALCPNGNNGVALRDSDPYARPLARPAGLAHGERHFKLVDGVDRQPRDVAVDDEHVSPAPPEHASAERGARRGAKGGERAA